MRVLAYFLNKGLVVWMACIAMGSCTNPASRLGDKSLIPANSLKIQYAKGFRIEKFDHYKKVWVFNPWEGAKNVQYCYILADTLSLVPDTLRKYPVIQTPVKKIVCLSTTHVAFLKELGLVESITGLSAPDFVFDSLVRKRIEAGLIKNIGYDQALNMELILSLKPDFVMAYGVGSEAAGQFQRLNQLGVKVVFNAEYLESSPLGKAEWIKFVGAFYNQEENADQIFSKTEKRYLQLCDSSHWKSRPKVLSGVPWKGTWFVPGGKSYAARFIKDAGGDYLWSADTSVQSLPLSFEVVMDKANLADIWINPGTASTFADMVAVDKRLSSVSSFKNGKVFNCNARTSAGGGNDFWESGVVHPDWILYDLIRIFHPEVNKDPTFVYYKQLK